VWQDVYLQKLAKSGDVATGVVRQFCDTFGFIWLMAVDDIRAGIHNPIMNRSVFVHQSDIETVGFRSLESGTPVEFRIALGERGFKAVNVRPF
jgi:cold shock CspA family protein